MIKFWRHPIYWLWCKIHMVCPNCLTKFYWYCSYCSMLEKDRKKDKQQAAQSAFQAKLNNIRKATKR